MMERTKQDVYGKIDNFFNKIIEIAELRKDQLKKEYQSIEDRERAHISGSMEKIRLESDTLQ